MPSQLKSSKAVAVHEELFGKAGCHTDAMLSRRPKEYAKLIKHCLKVGLLRLTSFCISELGIFFVSKKNGTLRLIVDCRKTNALFLDPPGVDLVTGEGLSNIELGEEIHFGEEGPFSAAQLGEHFRLAMGVADVSDCFHRCRLEGELCHYFAGLPSKQSI